MEHSVVPSQLSRDRDPGARSGPPGLAGSRPAGLARRLHGHDPGRHLPWAVRIYKTRSAATVGCRGGHVRVNRVRAKAATPVKQGDRIDVFVERDRTIASWLGLEPPLSHHRQHEQTRTENAVR